MPSRLHLLRPLLLCLLLSPLHAHAGKSENTDLAEKLSKLETELAVYKAEHKGELAQAQLAMSKDLVEQKQSLQGFATRLDGQEKDIDQWIAVFGILATIFAVLAAVLGFAIPIYGLRKASAEAKETAEKTAKNIAKTAATEWFAEKAAQHERQLYELEQKLQAASGKLAELDEKVAEVDACASAAIDGIGEKTAAVDQIAAKAQQDILAGRPITPTERIAVLQAGENSQSKAGDQLSWRDWNDRAFAAVANDDLVEAIRCWNRITTLSNVQDGPVASALLNKGLALRKHGDVAGALACYDQLLQRFSDTSEPALAERVARTMINKGVALGEQNNPDGEIACYDQLLQRFADATQPALQELIANALLNKGAALGQQNNPDAAIVSFNQVLERFIDATEPALRELVAKALFNKGVTLGQQGDPDGEIACYDQLLQRFADATEPTLRELVGKTLVNKAITLGHQNDPDGAIACYDQLLQRFADATEPALREAVAKARNGKGLRLLCQAKQHWPDQPQRQQLLQQASDLFTAALDGCADSDRSMILGNQSYCAHLLDSQPADWVRERMLQALKLDGEKLYKGTLDDLAIHPVAEKDDAFRVMLDEVWQQVQAAG